LLHIQVVSLLVLRLLVDTSVWLDTARDIHGERLIAAIRTLVHQRQVELLVPQVVVEEYERNRGQVVASLSASTRAHVRTVRAALAQHGRSDRSDELLAELDEVAVRGPLIEQLVITRFVEVRDLLEAGRAVAPDADTLRRVVQRGLAKKAPFHHAKNGVADAMLIETYRTVTAGALADPADRYAFVTHNTRDFSDPKDLRNPHPDLQDCFSGPHSGYFVRLEDALALHVSGATEPLDEFDFEVDPRSGQEILAAEQRLFDLIWYQRSLSNMNPLGEPGRRRVEEAYPAGELGPYTDFEWGMLNGKLSALRWVLGDEWDFLDT
jgi:PIN domain